MTDCMTVRAVVRDTGADGGVQIEIDESQLCSGCAGTCMWRWFPDTTRGTRAALAANPSVRPGMSVLVSLPRHCVVLSAVALHGLPWAALLAGALAGVGVTGTDLGCFVGAVSGVALAAMLTPGLRRRIERATLRQVTLTPVR